MYDDHEALKRFQGTDQASTGRSIVAVLRGQWVVLLAAVTVVTTTAVVSAVNTTKQYTASASLLFRDPQLDQKLFGSSFVATAKDPNREATTNVKLASLDVIAERVASRLEPGTTADDVLDVTDVAAEGQSDVATVTAQDPDPSRASKIANLMAGQFVAYRREADQAKVREAQTLVARELAQMSPQRQRSSRGRSLEERSQQLQILTSFQTGNVEVAERASVPMTASSPRPLRSGISGLFAGLLIGLIAVFGRERLDRRLQDENELAKTFARPLLAAVPWSPRLEAGSLDNLRLAEAEPFRILRASLRYFGADKDRRTLVVVSAQSGDGKTLTAWHLAVASAQAGKRTLLLETDLRRPGVTRLLGDSFVGPGLSDVLTQDATFDAAVNSFPVYEDVRAGETRRLDILLAGPLPPDPIDLLDSAAMKALMVHVRSAYELVVVDTPPTTIVADAIPLLAEADGVIVVARVRATMRPALRTLQTQLGNLNAHVLGVVANAVRTSGSGYYYSSPYHEDRQPKKSLSDGPASQVIKQSASGGPANGPRVP